MLVYLLLYTMSHTSSETAKFFPKRRYVQLSFESSHTTCCQVAQRMYLNKKVVSAFKSKI